jgi:hypothetical protein
MNTVVEKEGRIAGDADGQANPHALRIGNGGEGHQDGRATTAPGSFAIAVGDKAFQTVLPPLGATLDDLVVGEDYSSGGFSVMFDNVFCDLE